MFQEEYARADAYALISQLFSAPPDASFLRLYSRRLDSEPEGSGPALTLQEPEPTGYDAGLRKLQTACSPSAADSIAQEYDRLFSRAGGSVAAVGAIASAPQLAALKQHLAACGLATIQSEIAIASYVSGTCDVMRYLIEHEKPADLQVGFFDEFVFTGVTTVCDAILSSPVALFYRAVAELAQTFIEAEKSRMQN